MGDISDSLFEELSDLVMCKNGSAINVKKAYDKLEVVLENYNQGIPPFAWFEAYLPVAVSYFDDKYGYHSALVVDTFGKHSKKGNYGLKLVGANQEKMLWGDFCHKLPWHEHQLCFVRFINRRECVEYKDGNLARVFID